MVVETEVREVWGKKIEFLLAVVSLKHTYSRSCPDLKCINITYCGESETHTTHIVENLKFINLRATPLKSHI